MATKRAFTIRITNPDGTTSREIPVKPSTIIHLEERMGVPLAQRIDDGYTGAFARLGYEVGQSAGVIPDDMTFDDFVDEDGWVIDVTVPHDAIPKAADATTEAEVEQLAGE